MGASKSSLRNRNSRRATSTGRRPPVPPDPTQLVPYQKTLLRQAWQHISKTGTSNIGSMIFRRILSKNKQIKNLFQHVTVIEGVFGFGLTPIQVYHHHGAIFVDLLEFAIDHLNEVDDIRDRCLEYGAKHAPFQKYGFRPEHWDTFGEAMMEAAREWEGWRRHRETLKAWTILISYIVDRMRQGYEDALRRVAMNSELDTGSFNNTPSPEQKE